VRYLKGPEPEELYDLKADPEELTNLAADPQRKSDLERLRALWSQELRAADAPYLSHVSPLL
jgi:arylsulfatase A-like enzyme